MIISALLLLILFVGHMSSAQENSLEDVCNNATNGSWNSDGFVCVTEFSHFYVSCNKTDNSACFLTCPSDTRCSAPAGEFVDSNPCSKTINPSSLFLYSHPFFSGVQPLLWKCCG